MGVQTQLTEKNSDNFELGSLQFYSGGSMVYFKETCCFPRFLMGSNVFQGVELFSGVGVKMLISVEKK